MGVKVCTIQGCEKKYYAKSLRSIHYQRNRIHGDPLKVMVRMDGRWKQQLYHKYINMIRRCYNPNDADYTDYGGRGIEVDKEWRDEVNGIWRYIEYINKLDKPSELHKYIDRIDNDGNYEPGNLRWATLSEQNRNRRPFKNKTGYPGVVKMHNRYHAKIWCNGKQQTISICNTAREAGTYYFIAKQIRDQTYLRVR